MKLKPFTKSSSVSLILLTWSLGSVQANVTWVGGAAGVWEDPANWLSDDAVPVNRLPVNNEWIRPTAVAVITYSEASSPTNLPNSTIWQDSSATTSFLQTGGDLTVNQIYLAKLKTNDTAGTYTITGGRLFVNRNMNMTWSNSGAIDSRFVQAGGSVRIGDNNNEGLWMCIKSNGQVANYDLQAGDFEASIVGMCNGGANSTAIFTQSEGTTAVINRQLQMGKTAGATGAAIYNLDGGTLTIEADLDPFLFTQPGAPVYFDFDGGTLNLKGNWDFTSLTAILNSDFRVAGNEVADGDLAFEAVTIDTEAYTRITVNTGLDLAIASSGNNLIFTWTSKAGKVYDLLSATDLTTTPDTWTPWQSDIPGTPPTNVETYPRPGDAMTFFVVVEKDAPPIFAENFDGVTAPALPAGWIADANVPPDTGTTAWQLGDPGGGAATGPSAASSGTNCCGTNIAANYGLNTDITLRSPAIDLTAAGITGAKLTFQQFRDLEAGFDFGQVRVLKSSDSTQLGANVATDINGTSAGWEELTASLPPEAIGETVVLEFQFTGDKEDAAGGPQAGWYIDDVAVSVQ